MTIRRPNKEKAILYTQLEYNEEIVGEVFIWKPKKIVTEYGPEYHCYHQLLGDGFDDNILRRAIGISSMQAVILAIKFNGTIIKYSDFVRENSLDKTPNWDNFGFPDCGV